MPKAAITIPLPSLKLPRSLGVFSFKDLEDLAKSELEVSPMTALRAMAEDAVVMKRMREAKAQGRTRRTLIRA